MDMTLFREADEYIDGELEAGRSVSVSGAVAAILTRHPLPDGADPFWRECAEAAVREAVNAWFEGFQQAQRRAMMENPEAFISTLNAELAETKRCGVSSVVTPDDVTASTRCTREVYGAQIGSDAGSRAEKAPLTY